MSYAVNVRWCEEIGGPTPLALNTEWLLTDGLGGFAMGSVSGVGTRRYHGLLTVAASPPVERFNLLAGMLEKLSFGGASYEIGCHEFQSPGNPAVFHPHGYQYLYKFEKAPGVARWWFRVGPVEVVKELRLTWRPGEGQARGVLTYTLEPVKTTEAIGGLVLELSPLVAMRDFHQHRRPEWGDPFQLDASTDGEGARLRVSGDIPLELHLAAEGCEFQERKDWWHNFRRRREAERGQDDLEDLFVPGSFVRKVDKLSGPVSVKVFVGTGEMDRVTVDDGRAGHLRELELNVQRSTSNAEHSSRSGLVEASDDFVVSRFVGGEEFRSIVAGYPWFGDWGRDTMISLPGLLLSTGRVEEAGQTLMTFARHMRNGLVPNLFDDHGGEPHYNTVDGSLWFVHACLEYYAALGSKEVWRDALLPACRQVIAAYRDGTDGPIKMAEDGLISAGNETTQLTWMDAKRDGVVFTPRWGKCVEINALWHRALSGLAQELRGDDPEMSKECFTLARRVEQAFAPTFWNKDLGYLLDHVNPMGSDPSLRPNQVLAVSMKSSSALLSPQARQDVMRIVREKLLTPMGLRTLPHDDPNYHGRHTGSMFERDRAYHQGTVWPWLIGPYVEGWLRAYDFSAEAREHGREAVAPLLEVMSRNSLGQIHEVYDGDEPHQPSGCIAQAWSVAELLRVVVMIESPESR